MTPPSGRPTATSDQYVSLRRSSNGKSNRVASICVVSSIDTLSTQLNVSPSGSSSRMRPARSRIVPSSLARFIGATTPLTVLRCRSCLGGSIAMNIGISKSSGSSSSDDAALGGENVVMRVDVHDVVELA